MYDSEILKSKFSLFLFSFLILSGVRFWVPVFNASDGRKAIANGSNANASPVETPPVSCSRYVSPAGSDADSGEFAEPWRTAQHAFDAARPGDTVCFRAGTYPPRLGGEYSQALDTSGTPDKPIVFMNYPGEMAILQGSTRVNAAYLMFLGRPTNAPGLTFEGPTGPGVDIDLVDVMHAHDVTFDHVEIRNGDYHAGLYQYGGYNIRLVGCFVHDNGRFGMTVTPQGDYSYNVDQGIYWDLTRGGGNLIANSVIEHNRAEGIALYPSPNNVVIEQNTIVGNENYGIVVYGSRNVIVNNIFSNNGLLTNSRQMSINAGSNHLIDSNILWSPIRSQQGYLDETSQNVTRSFIVDPWFADFGAHNYHLRATSPASKTGNSKYGQLLDKDGRQRYQANLGAYAGP